MFYLFRNVDEAGAQLMGKNVCAEVLLGKAVMEIFGLSGDYYTVIGPLVRGHRQWIYLYDNSLNEEIPSTGMKTIQRWLDIEEEPHQTKFLREHGITS